MKLLSLSGNYERQTDRPTDGPGLRTVLLKMTHVLVNDVNVWHEK